MVDELFTLHHTTSYFPKIFKPSMIKYNYQDFMKNNKYYNYSLIYNPGVFFNSSFCSQIESSNFIKHYWDTLIKIIMSSSRVSVSYFTCDNSIPYSQVEKTSFTFLRVSILKERNFVNTWKPQASWIHSHESWQWSMKMKTNRQILYSILLWILRL